MVQLDVLRGAAILLVLGTHYVIDPKLAGILRIPATMVARFGWTGVDLFFVLSGFLVGGLLMREIKVYGKLDVRRFLIRRAWKIWPVYYLYFLFIAATLFLSKDHFAVPKWQLLMQYIFPLQNYNVLHLPYDGPLFAGHTWSLAVEEHFYLLLPLLLLLIAKDKRRLSWLPLMAVGLDVVCLALRWSLPPPLRPWTQLMPTHLRIDSLFTGVVLAYYYHFRPEVVVRAARWRPLLTAIGLLLVAPMTILPVETKRFVWTIGFTFLSLGYACLLTVFVTTPVGDGRLGRWFHSRMATGLAYVGGFSYSIYIWHIDLIMNPMKNWVKAGLLAGVPGMVRWPVLMIVYGLAAIGVGIALAMLTERPTLLLRDKLFPPHTDALGAVNAKDASPITTQSEVVADS